MLNSQACAKGQRFRRGPAELARPVAGLYSLVVAGRLAAAVLLLCRAIELIDAVSERREGTSNEQKR